MKDISHSVDKKIGYLIEEALKIKTKKRLKNAGIAGLGGLVGAGLDMYLNGNYHASEYLRPIAAWTAGGALSGVLQDAEDEDEDKEAEEAKEAKDKK